MIEKAVYPSILPNLYYNDRKGYVIQGYCHTCTIVIEKAVYPKILSYLYYNDRQDCVIQGYCHTCTIMIDKAVLSKDIVIPVL